MVRLLVKEILVSDDKIVIRHSIPLPHIPFERYADDAICYCKSAEAAQALWSALQDRFAACKLVLHP